MTFNKKYKLARLATDNALANSQNNNAAATNHLANEQHKTNDLLTEILSVKDRVDISKKEYEELIYDSKLLKSLTNVFNNLIDKTGLTFEEFAQISENDIIVAYHENPIDFTLYIDTRMKINLPLYRNRELLR